MRPGVRRLIGKGRPEKTRTFVFFAGADTLASPNQSHAYLFFSGRKASAGVRVRDTSLSREKVEAAVTPPREISSGSCAVSPTPFIFDILSAGMYSRGVVGARVYECAAGGGGGAQATPNDDFFFFMSGWLHGRHATSRHAARD